MKVGIIMGSTSDLEIMSSAFAVLDDFGVPYEKMPSNIVENFGNASGVTVPTCISYNLGEKLEKV